MNKYDVFLKLKRICDSCETEEHYKVLENYARFYRAKWCRARIEYVYSALSSWQIDNRDIDREITIIMSGARERIGIDQQ